MNNTPKPSASANSVADKFAQSNHDLASASQQTVIANNGNNTPGTHTAMETDATVDQNRRPSVGLRDSQMQRLARQITENLRIQQPNISGQTGKRKRRNSEEESDDEDHKDTKRGKPNIPDRYTEIY